MPRLTPPPNFNPRKPKLKLPAGAVDCHVHLFGPVDQYPFAPDASYLSGDATAEMYFAIQDQLGLSKAVLVSGGGYGQTYTHLAETLAKYPDRLRGVVRLPPEVTFDELVKLNSLGVKGARFFGPRRMASMTPALVEMVTAVGWHIQFYPEFDTLSQVADELMALDTTVVLDHFAHNAAVGDLNSANNRKLFEMLDSGRVWAKLSGPMRVSPERQPYPSVTPLAKELIKRWPDRLVWGSDWPHTNMWDLPMPDDGDLIDLIGDWMPDESTMLKILVENPKTLYGF